MTFPFVTRKKYDQLIECSKKLCARVIELEDERDAIIGRAADLADIEREDRKTERNNFEAILTNLRGEQ